MEIVVVVCVLAAIALGVCAWKLPNIRTWLVAGAGTLLGLAGLLIAMISARGDMDRVRRVGKGQARQEGCSQGTQAGSKGGGC